MGGREGSYDDAIAGGAGGIVPIDGMLLSAMMMECFLDRFWMEGTKTRPAAFGL